MMSNLESDYGRWHPSAKFNIGTLVAGVLTEPGFLAVACLRLQNQLLKRGMRRASRLLRAACLYMTSADFGDGVVCGPGLLMRHPVGVVIGGGTTIGSNVTILQNVTLGERYADGSGSHEMPLIEDGVTIGAGAKVLGGVRIGRGAAVGANAVVVTDVPEGATAVGVPAVIKAPQQHH